MGARIVRFPRRSEPIVCPACHRQIGDLTAATWRGRIDQMQDAMEAHLDDCDDTPEEKP